MYLFFYQRNCAGRFKSNRDGCYVDLILRDIGRVRNIVERTEEGDFCFEQTVVSE